MSMYKSFFSLSLLAGCALPLLAQVHEGPVPTTALIQAESKNGTPLNPQSLTLQVDGHATTITGVQPVAPAGAQVAILIDDGLRSSFSLQLKDMEKFITNLPQGTKVLIGYMQNGVVRSSGSFTADLQEVLSALRIPFSNAGISASPYFCLSDFVKHWPSNEPGARFVLMITNGVDPYNGRPSITNQDSPYVEAAQEDAQRAGVAVYSIYFSDSGFRGGQGSFSGQSYLAQVGDATGGQLFNNGPITPVEIAPFLGMFHRAIAESYEVSFMTSASHDKHDPLKRIKLKSSQPGVKIHAPDNVNPGVGE
jgi:hypothetical protein